jgi:arsenate reductase-like glutaredoxin family protein
MPRLQIDANELVNPEVNLVSLVKRGANRLPFRIVKEDTEPMLDLMKAAKDFFHKAETSPNVVGVLIAKGANVEGITAALVKAGIPADKFVKHESPTATTLTKADTPMSEDETVILKANDQVAFVISAPTEIAKSISSYDFESTSFSEIMTKGAFAPTLCMAQEMLQRTFFNIMEKAEAPKDLSNMLQKATDEFKAYIGTLAKALPDTMFKAEAELSKVGPVAKAPEKPAETKPAETAATAKPAAPAATATAETKKDEATTAAAAGAGTQATEGPKSTDPAAAELFTSMLDSLKDHIDTSVSGLRGHVEKQVGAVQGEVNKLSAQVKKAEEAFTGTVAGDAGQDKTGVTKSEVIDPDLPPLLDTGVMKLDIAAETQRLNGRRPH